MPKVNNKYQILKDYVTGNINWQRSTLSQINLSGSVLRGIDLTASLLSEVNLGGCNLEFADLSAVTLRKCNLNNAKLKGANFSGADLAGINLSHAHLELAHLRGANFTDADLSHAYFYCADLRGACLKGAKLDNAFFAGAIYDETTSFDENSLMAEMVHFSHLTSQTSAVTESDPKLENLEQVETVRNCSYRGIKYQSVSPKVREIAQNQLQTNEQSTKQIRKYRGIVCN